LERGLKAAKLGVEAASKCCIQQIDPHDKNPATTGIDEIITLSLKQKRIPTVLTDLNCKLQASWKEGKQEGV
jgi:hypothetical protein